MPNWIKELIHLVFIGLLYLAFIGGITWVCYEFTKNYEYAKQKRETEPAVVYHIPEWRELEVAI